MLKRLARIVPILMFSFASPLAANIIYTYDSNNPVTSAGALPATSQNLIGLFPEVIFGNFGTNLNAVNVFAINIMTPSNFSATTLDGGAHYAPDTEHFLFNINGVAVNGNDDISAINTFSCLPSAAASNPCPVASSFGPENPGTYYLAITRSNQLPFDSLANYLFAMTVDSSNVVGPDLTAGGAHAVAGWDGGAYNSPDFDNSYYAIALTGTVPEPGTFAMFAGVGLCGWLARRYRTRS